LLALVAVVVGVQKNNYENQGQRNAKTLIDILGASAISL
jgi:hypothetical protein